MKKIHFEDKAEENEKIVFSRSFWKSILSTYKSLICEQKIGSCEYLGHPLVINIHQIHFLVFVISAFLITDSEYLTQLCVLSEDKLRVSPQLSFVL